jgi:putative ABC transport system permease protein
MRLYRLLLRLFPRHFRDRFGDEMTRVFAARQDDARKRGAFATASLWVRTLLDVATHGTGERRRLLGEFAQDTRFALRLIRRRPGFSATAIITLALGIGVNVAMFSVVNGVLIRRLPFPSPQQLVRVGETSLTDQTIHASNPGNYLEYRDATVDTFAALGAYRLVSAAALTAPGAEAVKAKTIVARPEFFDVLGVPPAMGRLLNSEDLASNSRSVVISGPFWRGRLGADPNVIGRQLELDGANWTVVGVMPDGAEFPVESELWQPLRFSAADIEQRNSWNLQVIGRLRPGVTLEAANASIRRAMAVISRNHPGAGPGTARVEDLREYLVGPVRSSLLFAQGIAGLILLIACANLGNLLLTSASARRRELGIRASMGAGRGRVIRQLLTEALVLSMAGAVLGTLLAVILVPALVNAYPGFLPGRELIGVRWAELAVAAAAAFATAAIFGTVPSLLAARSGVVGNLHSAQRSGTTPAVVWLRNGLVVAEVVMALTLLAGSFALVRSFVTLTKQDVGFSRQNVVTAYLQIPAARFPGDAERRRVFEDLREWLSKQGDVEAAALAFPLPFDGASMGSRYRWDPALGLTEPLSTGRRYVSPGYLEALSLRLTRGRFVSPDDTAGSPLVAVVNESFAAKYGKTRDVVGMRFVGPNDSLVTIVGVAPDIRATYVRPAAPEIWLPLSQANLVMGSFIVKTKTPAKVISARFRNALHERYPFLPAGDIQPLTSVIDESVSPQRFNATLLASLAALALALAVVGIYGVMAYVASQRQREMAIRSALGALPQQIRALSLRQGLTPILVGIAGGLGGAWFLTSLLKKELFHVQPHDPWTLVGAAAAFFVAGLTACWIPARRSARVDPVSILKAE